MQRSILQVALRSRRANLAWSSAGRSGDGRFASAVMAPISQAMGVLLVAAALLRAWRPQEAATLSVANGVPLLVPLLGVQVELMLGCMLLLRLAGGAERVLLIEVPPTSMSAKSAQRYCFSFSACRWPARFL